MQRILAVLKGQPDLNVEAIALAACVSRKTLVFGGYLKQLRQQGLIHVGAWQRNPLGGYSPLYRWGPGDDLVRPRMQRQERNSAGVRSIEQALAEHGPMGYRQLAEVTGLSRNTLKNGGYLDALLVQRRIYILRWERNPRGPMRAIYAVGQGISAPRPLPLNNAEKSRRYRERKQVLGPRSDAFSTLLRGIRTEPGDKKGKV
ncbi:hypothetical protein VX159_09350 [Dechloromonas sp. ZY10]|uniref:hypothetical protein n=1 Tax=Dechloromonas aquae TaxID=2664436 RepID=UPI003529A661